MLAPLVHPQALVIAFVIFPVHGHVGEEIGGAKGLEDVSDVVVGAAVIAVGFVGAIASVGPWIGVSAMLIVEKKKRHSPQTVYSPRVIRPCGRVGVPELCLKHLTARVVEAA